MNYLSQIKPISYLKDITTYNETQETLVLLKILALGNREIEKGKLKPIGEVVKRLRTCY